MEVIKGLVGNTIKIVLTFILIGFCFLYLLLMLLI